MNSAILLDDHAENSIMQTITIAVSAILIAAGLVTAPGLINNARDNNARTDLANVAYAQEVYFGEVGTYNPVLATNIPGDGSLDEMTGVKYTPSGNIITTGVFCKPASAYVIKAVSTSGKSFYRTSLGAETSETLSDLKVPECLTPEDLAKIVSPAIDISNPGTNPGANPGTTNPGTDPNPEENEGGDDAASAASNISVFTNLGDKKAGYVIWIGGDASKITALGEARGEPMQVLPDQDGLTDITTMRFAAPVSNAGLYIGDRKVAAIADGTEMQFAYTSYTTVATGVSSTQAQFLLYGPQFYDIADIKSLAEGKVTAKVEASGQKMSFKIPKNTNEKVAEVVDATGYSNGDVTVKALPSMTNRLFEQGHTSVDLDTNSFKNTQMDYYLNIITQLGNDSNLDAEFYYSANNDNNYTKVGSGRVNISNTANFSYETYKNTTDPQLWINTIDSLETVTPGGTWKLVLHQAGGTYTITDIK
jgi:type II secretory pathway pseudopilin PulG